MASSSDVANKIMRYKLQLTNTEEAAKILKTLKKLKELEITLDVLVETGIGKTVNSLRRHELAGELAKSLVRDWKKLVPKGSKSPSTDDKTTDELPCTDNVKVVTEDFNNNYLTDERDEDEPVNKKIKKDNFDICKDQRGTNYLKKQQTSTNEFLNKTKAIEKEKKKNLSDQSHKESSDESLFKNHTSENILSKRKSKSHKRKKYNRFSDNERDLSESDSDKKPLKETKSKDQFCPEPRCKKSKDVQSPVRHSEAQNGKRRKHDKRKEKSPVTKTKKTKSNEKASKSDNDEPTMSFESYLNYDDNVPKRKERPKPKKPPPKSKPVFTKRAEKDVNILPEEPLKEPVKCSPVPVCPDSPIKISSESVMKIPDSPPLESWFPEVDLKRKAEKESDSCDILEESAIFTGQRLNKKMQVYSGAKTIFLPAMMSLYQQCIRTLQNNINLLYETGGVPFEILEPVLQRCTPEQLLRIEEFNPIYIGETDHLWGKHCQRDFKDAKLQEYESWKELYLRLSEERERKFKMLTKTISSAQSTKPKGRQVKMAFIHSVAKPPRDVRIKQEIHGTAVQQPLPKCSVKVQESRPRQIPKETTRPNTATSATTSSQDPRKKTKVAPMMAKSLKAFKKQFGRR